MCEGQEIDFSANGGFLDDFFFFFKASHTMNTARPVTENSDFFVSFVCVSLLLGRTCGPKTRVSKEH